MKAETKTVVKSITVTMTVAEAECLRAICRRVGGLGEVRDVTDALSRVLSQALGAVLRPVNPVTGNDGWTRPSELFSADSLKRRI